jgi:rare lipoprotein A
MRRFRSLRGRGAVLAVLTAAFATATTGLALAASTSSPTAASIDTSDKRARYGQRVTLKGSVPGAANAEVEIDFRRAGHSVWRTVRSTTTDAAGDFRARVRASQTGAFRARPVSAGGGSALGTESATVASASEPAKMRVVSRVQARAERNEIVGHGVRIRGRVKPGTAYRRIRIRVDGHTLRTRTRSDGRFSDVWRPSHTGRARVRVRAAGDRVAAGSRDRAGRVTVFRRATASWYGPGFYGNRTACGQTLTPSTLGVANKTLPCGTKLTLRYHGRQVRVRVIDRGPYVAGRDFDLTAATKQRLGFGSTGTILSSK